MEIKTTTDIFFAVSFTLFIALLISVEKLNNYEEHYLEEIGDKFDRDWTIASENVEKDTMGSYFSDTQNIIIYSKNREVWDVIETAYHESMHYLWYNFLNESERSEWELLFNQSVSHRYLINSEQIKLMTNGSILFVSSYAETNAKEDFAESGMNWALKKNRLSREKEEFMEKYVKELI